MFRSEETIAAVATGTVSGAISIIRISGPDAIAIADKVIMLRRGTIADAPGYSLRYGTIVDLNNKVEIIDDVMVSIFRAPHSYTGEDSIEIACHASSYIVSRIMEILVAAGARPAGPGEFTQRAFASGKMDLAQAEAVSDIIAASSMASLRVAMNQMRGGVSAKLKEMRAKMLEITSLLELELDFSEEDVEFADRTRLSALVDSSLAHVTALADTFKTGNAIKNGIPVAIVGAPNVGKSTLLNALIGDDRAIVSDIAGTTRDTIEEPFTIDGILFRFIDTAGIHDTDDTIEKIGVERALKKLEAADIVIAMADISSPVLDSVIDSLNFDSQKLIIVLNKADKFSGSIPTVDLDLPEDRDIPVLTVSAKTGAGLDALKALLVESQKDTSVDSDTVLITNARHHSALLATAESLTRVKDGLQNGIPSDLVAQDLRDALYHLGTITGEISSDEILGNIFSHFCVGK